MSPAVKPASLGRRAGDLTRKMRRFGARWFGVLVDPLMKGIGILRGSFWGTPKALESQTNMKISDSPEEKHPYRTSVFHSPRLMSVSGLESTAIHPQSSVGAQAWTSSCSCSVGAPDVNM